MVLPGSSPITATSPSWEAHRKSGSFAQPALPGIIAHTTLSDSRPSRRLKATLRPRPSPKTGLPDDPCHPSNVPCPISRRIETGACVDCFPVHAAFPVMEAGRHPHIDFRDLLRLHSRYGPLNCSTAQGGLCHEAPAQPVTQPNRSSATGANRQLSGWLLPPLVTRALGAHSITCVRRVPTPPAHDKVAAVRSPRFLCGARVRRWPCDTSAAMSTGGA